MKAVNLSQLYFKEVDPRNGLVPGTIITMDNPKWLHYGKAQTEATLTAKELPKGKHKLTLQFADWEHKSYGPTLSKTINIVVE